MRPPPLPPPLKLLQQHIPTNPDTEFVSSHLQRTSPTMFTSNLVVSRCGTDKQTIHISGPLSTPLRSLSSLSSLSLNQGRCDRPQRQWRGSRHTKKAHHCTSCKMVLGCCRSSSYHRPSLGCHPGFPLRQHHVRRIPGTF